MTLFPPSGPLHPAPDALGNQAPVAAPRYNLFALISFISTFFVPVLGVVFGHVALKQVEVTGEPGRGFARAGLIIGYAFIALTLIAVFAYAAIIAAVMASIPAMGGYSY